MTFKEFGQLADAIKTYFPKDNMLPTDTAMELWYDMLKDMDYKSAYIGLKNHVATSRFPPTIADIRNGTVISQPNELNEAEAWSLVSKAIRNSGYNSAEEFAKLPPLVQKAVGLPSQLRTWALDENFNEQLASSNFMKCYRNELARQREFQKMPKEVQNMIVKVNKNSYSRQIEQRRQELKENVSRKNEEIKVLNMKYNGIPMPEKYKERLKDIRNGD